MSDALPPIPRRFLTMPGMRFRLLWCYSCANYTGSRWHRIRGYQITKHAIAYADRSKVYPHVVLDAEAGVIIHRNAEAAGAELEP